MKDSVDADINDTTRHGANHEGNEDGEYGENHGHVKVSLDVGE